MNKFERYEELANELETLEFDYKIFVKENTKKMDELVNKLDIKCMEHHARVCQILREMRRLEDGRNSEKD